MLKGLLALMAMSEDECADFEKNTIIEKTTTKGEKLFSLMLNEVVTFCNLNSDLESRKEGGLSLKRALRE